MQQQKLTMGVYLSVLELKDLDMTSKIILNVVLSNRKRNYWEQEYLALMLGVSRPTIEKSFKKLIEKGYIFRTKPKQRRYYLTYATQAALNLLPNKNENNEIKDLFNKVVMGA